MWITSTSDVFPWSPREEKSLSTAQEENHFFNPLMTETNCFAAQGRDLSQMCKPDPVAWTLCRPTASHFYGIWKWSPNNTSDFFFDAKLSPDGLACWVCVCARKRSFQCCTVSAVILSSSGVRLFLYRRGLWNGWFCYCLMDTLNIKHI